MREFFAGVLLTMLVAVPGAPQDQEPAPDPHQGQPTYCINHAGDREHPLEEGQDREAHLCLC